MCRGTLDVSRLRQPTITRASVLFLGTLIVSAVLGLPGQTRAEFRGVYFIASYIGFYLVMFVWLDTRERLRKLILTLFVSTLAVCRFAFYQSLADGYTSLWYKLYTDGTPFPLDAKAFLMVRPAQPFGWLFKPDARLCFACATSLPMTGDGGS